MVRPNFTNTEFELGGINHVALVCSDMARTVDFYTNVLGMPLIKSIDLPEGMGQHFFFDAGNGDCVAFFWFTEAPDGEPGTLPAALPGLGSSERGEHMNHLAFHVPAEKFDAYRNVSRTRAYEWARAQPRRKPAQVAATLYPGVYVRSFYFPIRTASSWSSPAGQKIQKSRGHAEDVGRPAARPYPSALIAI